MELEYGEYQVETMNRGRIIGGLLVKNIQSKRWEFHAQLNLELPTINSSDNKKAIVSVDFGIQRDASIVVLLESQPLKKEQFHILTEKELRSKRHRLHLRRNYLLSLIKQPKGYEYRRITKELKDTKHSISNLNHEISHNITKKIITIAQEYKKKGYSVSICCGKIQNLGFKYRKGSKSSKSQRKRRSNFQFLQLVKKLEYKAIENGYYFRGLNESWTSCVCHKCESTNTDRNKGLFLCNSCGLKYNADFNGAINIGLRFLKKELQQFATTKTKEAEAKLESSFQNIKVSFLNGKTVSDSHQWFLSMGFGVQSHCDEQTGELISHTKVSEAVN